MTARANGTAVVLRGAVVATGTDGPHGERSPGIWRRGEGATELCHGQAGVSDLVHGLGSKQGKLGVGVGQRERDGKRRAHAC